MKEATFIKKFKFVFREERYILIAAFSTAIILFLFSFFMGLITIPILNIATIRMLPVTFFDIIFMLVFSLIAGISIAFYSYVKRNAKGFCTISTGIFTGFLTSICPFCPIFLFAALGASITLEFLAPYFPFLRVLSLLLLLLSLYWLSKTIKLESDKK